MGAVFTNSDVIPGPGAMGSWMCTTSNCSSLRARMIRSWAAGSGASGATEPLAAVGIELPNGVMPGSGGGPSQGARTRTSWPSPRMERAMPSTCPWTPPGMVRL